MRILMFGWEFPPHMSGGLGTACQSMVNALTKQGTEVVFVMPHTELCANSQMKNGLSLCSASDVEIETSVFAQINQVTKELWEKNLTLRPVNSFLFPYATAQTYKEKLKLYCSNEVTQEEHTSLSRMDIRGGYGPNLLNEVYRYSQAAAALALENNFDVIHAHDWMTYPAAILAKKLTGKPLVTHIHALEVNRSGEHLNQEVAHIEWAGLNAADKIVAVSHYTKKLVMEQYKIPEEKIEVVHNAVSRDHVKKNYHSPALSQNEKWVLFLGRVTFQKGPDYFVEAARLVLDRIPNARFIMSGSGDMLARMIRRVAQLRMGHRFHFTGFLRGEDVDHMYALSDVYVMPSVSEPFGLTPLEAMVFDVPVIITRQSGVSEVLTNALVVDFWDVNEMANKICALLTSPTLASEVVDACKEELKNIRWENAAAQLNKLYAQLQTGGN